MEQTNAGPARGSPIGEIITPSSGSTPIEPQDSVISRRQQESDDYEQSDESDDCYEEEADYEEHDTDTDNYQSDRDRTHYQIRPKSEDFSGKGKEAQYNQTASDKKSTSHLVAQSPVNWRIRELNPNSYSTSQSQESQYYDQTSPSQLNLDSKQEAVRAERQTALAYLNQTANARGGPSRIKTSGSKATSTSLQSDQYNQDAGRQAALEALTAPLPSRRSTGRSDPAVASSKVADNFNNDDPYDPFIKVEDFSANQTSEFIFPSNPRPLPPIPTKSSPSSPTSEHSPRKSPHRRTFASQLLGPRPQPGKSKMSGVPQPGPAKLTANSGPEEWLKEAKQCHYLPEAVMKQLCERVKESLMEESNIQPVTTPVTICGDIHGQFYDLLELFRVAGGMPGEDNPQKPLTRTTTISSDDIEPPTEITDPSLRRKIRSSDSGIESGAGEDDDDDEPRGRPRTAGQSSRGGSSGGDSAIGVQESSGKGAQNFIFLGDFVDRGYFSLETFTLLLCLKALYPDKITLVRGNHESRQITQVYGFYEECQQKYGNASVWKSCCQVFDFLVLAAIVDGEILCVHGGLSPEIRTVDQIRVVARAQEIPHEGAFCDLVWSDPEDIDTWAISPRGAGWLFGDKVATEFNHVNGLKLIARAHQLVNEGYKFHFAEKSVVTVWSAPNYCYRCGNVASIMNVGKDLDPKFSIFSAVPEEQRAVPAGRRGAGDYFL